MSGKRIKWTPEEDTELRAAYAKSSFKGRLLAIRALAERKGVAVYCCWNRARRIGCILLTNNHRRWSKPDEEILAAYAGKIPPSRIAKIMHRSEHAIHVRLSRMAISGQVKEKGYTRGDLADLMGMDERTLRALLKKYRMPTNLFGNFSESAVQLWIWDHMEEMELRKFDQPWLKAMLRRAA